MKELDFNDRDYNLPLSSWIKIIAVAVVLFAFIFGMFDLMKWHH